MKNLIWVLPLAFIVGCGDKDEDTGVDTAVDTEETEGEE